MKQLRLYFIRMILLMVAHFSASGLLAQQPAQFNHFSAAHELSQNCFYWILQDRKGYMWFATSNGLIKYDGYAFTVFHHEPGNQNSLPDNYVTRLCEDTHGNIWMLSGDGLKLSKYDPRVQKFTTYRHNEKDSYSLSSDAVSCMVAGQNGSVWIGTADAGLCKYDPAADKFIDYGNSGLLPDTLCSKTIFSLMVDHKGSLWIGTNKGVNVFDPVQKKMTAYKPGDQNRFAKYNNGNCLFEDHAYNVWIGYYAGGVVRLNPVTGTTRQYYNPSGNNPGSPGWNFVNSISEDHNNTVWIATYTAGLCAYQPQTDSFRCFSADKRDKLALSSNRIMHVYEDRSGVLWIATNGGGLNTLDNNKKFRVYQQAYDNDYASNYSLRLYKNSKGKILINTFGAGVKLFDPVTSEFKGYRFNKAKGKGHFFDATYCSLEDSNGTLWVGSTSEGLHELDLETGAFITRHAISDNADSTAYNQVNCMAEDQQKRLWLGTNTGLKSFNLKTKTWVDFKALYPGNNELNEDNINNLYCDPQGVLWIAGSVGGLTLFNTTTGELQIFKHDDKNLLSISSNVIYCFYDDLKEAQVWIGTSAGLNMFDKKSQKIIAYTTLNGLPGNSVTGIVADNNGNLWLSGDEGICRFTPPDFVNRRAICRNYNMSDGLPGNEYYFNTCTRGDDNTLYFGSNAGVVAFKPDDLKDNAFIPPVLITDFRLFNKTLAPNDSTGILKVPADETKEIRLSYRQNNFTFTFTALSFVHPEKNQYAYKLGNYDKEWIYTDAGKRSVNYTNLDPGDYSFQVKASNNDGVWNEAPIVLHLIITPPIWQTWWFRAFLLLLTAAIIYGMYRLRLREVMRLQNIRNKISADLHDEIGSTINSISVYSEVAKQDTGKHAEALEMIGEASRKIIDAMSDIVWTINPKNDSFENIILHMRSLAFNLFRAKDIEFTFPADENLNRLKLSMESRRNLFLIFKEAVNNIIKYADASLVSIQLVYDGSLIKLTIRDNGKGFDTLQPSTGNGLNNMKRRAKEMKAVLKIESLIGTGTRIELIMKS